MWLLYLAGIVLVLWGAVNALWKILQIPVNLGEKYKLQGMRREIEAEAAKLESERERFRDMKAEAIEAITIMCKEKSLGFPWVAAAHSEYLHQRELRIAQELEDKDRPARKGAQVVREMSAEKAALRRENRILRELHRYYESLFPWLIDFKGEDLDELIRLSNQPRVLSEAEDDPVVFWLSDAERDSETLTRSEKFQRALDRWWLSKKTPWQIGKDYERYVGYLYEQDGFAVEYHGIEQGLEDLGRDLICIRGREVRIVQCKYWSGYKTMHEKHVCQVYGSSAAYSRLRAGQNDLFERNCVSAWLYVSCEASPTAREFATLLDVNLMDGFQMSRYPIIKCNVSLKDGAKIYHLPFDQQYDRTKIEFKDEQYVETVAEAERLGFRRAYRWRGNRPIASSQ